MKILTVPAGLDQLKKTSEVCEWDDAYLAQAKAMLALMKRQDGIGLAAPQVGILRRFFVMNVSGKGDPSEDLVIVNPVIVSRSRHTRLMHEGCLSLPGVSMPVTRPAAITLEALAGHPSKPLSQVSIEADGLVARVMLHEAEHLDGILISDKFDRKTTGGVQ